MRHSSFNAALLLRHPNFSINMSQLQHRSRQPLLLWHPLLLRRSSTAAPQFYCGTAVLLQHSAVEEERRNLSAFIRSPLYKDYKGIYVASFSNIPYCINCEYLISNMFRMIASILDPSYCNVVINICVCLMKLIKHESWIVKADFGCVNLNSQRLGYLTAIWLNLKQRPISALFLNSHTGLSYSPKSRKVNKNCNFPTKNLLYFLDTFSRSESNCAAKKTEQQYH